MAKYTLCVPECRINIRSLCTAFEIQRNKGFYFAGEAHPFWEMVCVLDGSVGVTADNEIYKLSAGQVVFHKPMEFHRLWSDEGTAPIICIFSFNATKMPALDGSVFSLSLHNQQRIKRALSLFLENYEVEKGHIKSVKPGRENEAYSAVCYLEYLVLSISSQKPDTMPESTDPSAKKYAEIVGVMNKNIGSRLSLDEIASLCNMSVSNLKKVFFRYSGQGIAEYFNEMKIRRAIMMMSEDKTVKEISSELGFYDQNYFSTVFKRITGKSPVKYKKDVMRGEYS